MMNRFRSRRTSPRLDQIEAKRICVIKPSALGDVVQTLPVLAALRSRFPRAHIAWVVNRAYAELLAGHPHLDEVIVFDRGRGRPWMPAAWRAMRELCRTLRSREFELVIDLQCLFRSGLMTWATGAGRRVGLDDAREGARISYTDIIEIPCHCSSAVDRYWCVADAVGAGGGEKQFLIHLPDDDRHWAERQLAGFKGLCVAIHPGARWSTKRWPEEHFAEIARRMHRDFGANLFLVGGLEEAEVGRRVAVAAAGRCLNLVGQTTLKQLASILGRVHLLFTNDSGPMHLAAALGTPVAAIFTCTSPQRARPYGDDHLLLASNLWCAASYLKKCSRMHCMTELTPDRLWPALAAKLASLKERLAA